MHVDHNKNTGSEWKGIVLPFCVALNLYSASVEGQRFAAKFIRSVYI